MISDIGLVFQGLLIYSDISCSFQELVFSPSVRVLCQELTACPSGLFVVSACGLRRNRLVASKLHLVVSWL